MEHGQKVKCNAPSIDRRIGLHKAGTIMGFSRLSAYHGREALVKLADGESDWFWCSDLTAA